MITDSVDSVIIQTCAKFFVKIGSRHWKFVSVFFLKYYKQAFINMTTQFCKIFGKIKDYCNGVRTIKSTTTLVLLASNLKI